MSTDRDRDFEDWLATCPETIKGLAQKYPPDIAYKIKKGAPYGISSSGSIVNIFSYLESGRIRVVVPAKYKSQAAINHERRLGEMHGKSHKEIKAINESDVLVEVDPFWLEPILQKHNEN
jgi:hypothetical protein